MAKLPQMKMLIAELVKNTTYWFYWIEVSEFKPTRQFWVIAIPALSAYVIENVENQKPNRYPVDYTYRPAYTFSDY